MKAILELPMPQDCCDCIFSSVMGAGTDNAFHMCNVIYGLEGDGIIPHDIFNKNERAPFCPLKIAEVEGV